MISLLPFSQGSDDVLKNTKGGFSIASWEIKNFEKIRFVGSGKSEQKLQSLTKVLDPYENPRFSEILSPLPPFQC